MSTSTFLIALPITILILIVLRYFWFELYMLVQIIKVLFGITVLSFGSAIIWSIFIQGDEEGFWMCWLYFGIAYLVAVALAFGILMDIFRIGVDLVRYIFKIK